MTIVAVDLGGTRLKSAVLTDGVPKDAVAIERLMASAA